MKIGRSRSSTAKRSGLSEKLRLITGEFLEQVLFLVHSLFCAVYLGKWPGEK
jgi:hypothetical protein